MASKSVLVQDEKVYSKKDLSRLKKLGKQIKEAQKDQSFRKAVKEFIKQTT